MTLLAPTISSGTIPDARATAPCGKDVGCDVCQHSLACHDAIGLRFCRATLNGAITRGCVCRPS
ncbi:RGCVC family protein [Geodermatophilus obscurus]|uniref:RGCVC family protein n=1 Tax=Geodermatophilus obscurus TaxID=1861 RepID=UPI001AA17F19